MPQKLAFIRASDCIGCTKCLDACPTDAIFGAEGLLHEIILEDCIGCERCVPVCPTDCIELINMPSEYDTTQLAEPLKSERILYIRQLAQEHKMRLQRRKQEEQAAFERAKNEAQARQAYLNSLFNEKK